MENILQLTPSVRSAFLSSVSPNNRLEETCSLGLPCTFLIYDIMLCSIDTCQIKLSADQYHVTITRAQVYSSSRLSALFKLTTDQVVVFN